MLSIGLLLFGIAFLGLIFAAHRWGEGRAGWSAALLVVGVLISTSTGLCTGYVIVGTAIDAAHNVPHDLPPSTVITGAVVVGGIPFLIGIATIWAARNRSKRKPPPSNPDVFR